MITYEVMGVMLEGMKELRNIICTWRGSGGVPDAKPHTATLHANLDTFIML